VLYEVHVVQLYALGRDAIEPVVGGQIIFEKNGYGVAEKAGFSRWVADNDGLNAAHFT